MYELEITVARVAAELRAIERGGGGALAATHQLHLVGAVAAGEPIHLVLPAFPAKAPNARKVLGPLPDRAEELALAALQELCDRIRAVYAPGARMTIASDGRVFADLVDVPDEAVRTYVTELERMRVRAGARDLEIITMDAFWPCAGAASQRAALMWRHGREDVRARVLADEQVRAKLNGLARFMFEDLVARDIKGASRTQLRAAAKERAYRMLARSQAWSAALAARYPDAVRLSVHPQLPGSPKLGIRLLECADLWMTPWHGVAVQVGTRWLLMKREDAERAGARVADGFMRMEVAA